jgi:predicted nucleotidyltransferase
LNSTNRWLNADFSAPDEKLRSNPIALRQRVATEAATLLYFGAKKEYKQAKLKAAETLGTHFLPTNREVALELDRIAHENEGPTRKKRLTEMRQEAYNIMNMLKQYNPIVIGSVWRGTIRRGSDIDIALYHNAPNEIVNSLATNNLRVVKTEWTVVTKHGKTETSFHIHAETIAKNKVEIVVRSEEEVGRKRKCEIFGDTINGLSIKELEKVLAENPTAQFIPT